MHVKCLWKELWTKFQKDFILPSLTPQAIIFGLYNEANDNYNLLSHTLFFLNIIFIYQGKNAY